MIGWSWKIASASFLLALKGGVSFGQAPSTTAQPGAPAINFARQIRPILSDNCFLCHGPDQGTRMVDLRLDTKDGLLATRKNGAPVVPGQPDQSLLIKRISSENAAFRMPPAYSHKTLTEAQKKLFRQWVEQGAKWEEHWAFAAPKKAALPEVLHAAWARNEIDRFLLAKMEASGLSPAPEADRRALIRRVTLDLTGLPPKPAEVKAFLADKASDAYEKVVDRLLASPQYGEHRARYWLDAARYADTQGLHIDNYREMWPYRDWVIQAFNRDMPFDQFTVEQLAGDLLPSPTLDQRIASGFHRNNVTTNEGGAIIDEVAAMYAKDRADTTGTVWLGLTVGCATCHDHKFDPISQKEYYSLTSFFRNTTQHALDGNIADTPPSVVVPQGEDRTRWELLNRERTEILHFLAEREASATEGFEHWVASPGRGQISGDPAAPRVVLDVNSAQNLPSGVTKADDAAAGLAALHFDKSGLLSLPSPAFENDKPMSVSTWIYMPKKHSGYTIAGQVVRVGEGKPEDQKRVGWQLDIGTGNTGVDRLSPGFRIFTSDGKFIGARPGVDFELAAETWYHVVYSYDGSRDRKGITLFVNGTFVPTYGTGEDLTPLEKWERTGVPVTLGGTTKPAYEDGAVADFRIFSRELDESDAKLLRAASLLSGVQGKPAGELSAAEQEALRAYYVLKADPEAKPRLQCLHAIDRERYAIAHRSPVTFVMQERTDTKPVAHVLYRGQYDQPKDEVLHKVPSVLPPLPPSYPQNRLGLAKWIVDANNPLPSRVTVNRFWQEVFGTGLVRTAEDFGSQGEPPSHPELLDWLAVDFRESGWDVKRLFRQMVTSAAYRQSAVATPEKLEKDPDNRLLSRGPRFRMDGEMVRDYALAVSGLLDGTIGGPSVKPYQPPNIWEAVAMDVSNTRVYRRDDGSNLYRRSLYTFWKRSAPPAAMDILNAPSRETCVVRRERTNTPLQALLTMNDPQFVEAARVLAQRTLFSSAHALNERIDYMSELLLARRLEPRESEVVSKSYKDFLNFYDANPQDAGKLLAVGEAKPDPRLSKAELAAMTMVANEMLNLDEVLVK